MMYQDWHKVIIAYRLEDEYGNSPCYYDGYKTIMPEGYFCAHMNPCRFRESDYTHFCCKMSLYEYALTLKAITFSSGEVLFTEKDVLSKTIVRR